MAHLQNPTLMPSFEKEPSKATHQNRAKWTDSKTPEKKHEPVTAVLQKSGFSG